MTNQSKTIASRGSRGKGFFYGWWVIAALFLVGMFGGVGRYSLTALAPFIQTELLWTKSQIGMAFSIHLWVYSLFVLLVGWMLDRVGGRRVIFLGGLVLLIALMLLSWVSTIWHLYLFYGLISALGVGMIHFVPVQATSRKWFIRRAGLAGGIISSAPSLGTAIFAPALTGMADFIDWRTTWFICALGFGIVIMLLAWLVIRDTPESVGLHPDGMAELPPEAYAASSAARRAAWSPREALRTSTFWLLFVAFSFPFIPLEGMWTQVVMWGVDLEEPQATAGIFLTAITLPSVLSRMLGGWLGDRYAKRRLLILAYFATLLIMVGAWLTVDSRSSLFIIAALFGLSVGLPLAVFVPYLGDLFGRASLGTLVGVLAFGGTFIGGFGPLIWGRIAHVTGSYNLACLVSAITYAIAIVALMLLKPEKLALRR